MVSSSCGTNSLQKIPNIKVSKDVANGLTRGGRTVTCYNK
jgi:hypothetical protein